MAAEGREAAREDGLSHFTAEKRASASVCVCARWSESVWRKAAAPALSSSLAPSDIKHGCGGFSAAATASSSAATQTRARRQARKKKEKLCCRTT